MVRSVWLSAVVFTMLIRPTPARAEAFGDWFTDTSGRTTVYAVSKNDGGNVFGQFCLLGEGSCVWAIGLETPCEKGETYAVLVNSDAGAVHLAVQCDGQLDGGLYKYMFTVFDQVNRLVKQGTRLAFAIPIQNDEFRVVRFSLRGAPAALSVMRAAASMRMKPGSRVTRDDSIW